jgi:Carboxypeptidase regulatory-like domain/TonB dependent receptor
LIPKPRRLSISFFLLVGFAAAQTDHGTITGTITDAAKAVVPNAVIAAKNVDTGAIFQTVATGTGNFTVTSLPAGNYEVTVELPGFRKYVGQNVRVQVAQISRLDVSLEVGSTTDSITVQGSAPQLKSESVEQAINVSGNRINNLPLNFGGGGGNIGAIRAPLTFMILSPGVAGTGTTGRVNGEAGNTYRIFVDGQDTTNNNDTTSTAGQPSVEMIQEFSLQTSNFSAEFGQVSGGMFTFATRSGTNQVHGSLYEYFANEALDAAKPFVSSKPISRKHDFGFSLSGPVWIPKVYDGRNRTFIFLNWEEYRNDVASLGSLNTVPTAAYRRGDFSGALTGRILGTDSQGRSILENTIYDPKTQSTVNGRVVRNPFPGNIIPQQDFDPVAVKIQALIPMPDFSGNINNWNQAPKYNKISATPAIKIDQALSNTYKLSFYLNKNWNHTVANGQDGLPIPLTAYRDQRTYTYTTRLNLDATITPRLLSHVGVGFVRFLNPDSSPDSVLNYDAAGLLGFTGSATGGGFPRIAGLTSSQGGMLGMGPTNANHYWTGKLTIPLSVSYIHGNHSYKIGGEYRLESYTDRNTRGASGVLNFSAAETGLPSTQGQNLNGGGVGFPYASFLLGRVDNATVNASQDPQWRNSRWGLFIQDTWKVSQKLTLDYGLRWDLLDQGHEIWNRNSMFGPTTPNPSAGGLLGGMIYEGYGPGRCNCRFMQKYPYSIGPRLGAAYQITPKTVLRAGWGVVYANLSTYQYFTNSAILGVGIDQLSFTAPAFGDPSVILKQGLVYNVADLHKVTLDPGGRPSPGQVNSPNYYLDPNADRPGRIHQWSINLQRQAMQNLVVEAAYVGNRGAWLSGANGLVNLNAISDQRLAQFHLSRTSAADQLLLTSRIDSPLAASRGFTAPYAGFPAGQTVAQSLRPYPQFSSALSPMWSALGNNWYDSLQAKVTKNYSHGLDFTSAFTWSKELATGQGVNDAFNRPNQKSLVSSSQPFIFVIGFNYETPKVTESKIVSNVVHGWTLGGIMRYASGLPIAVPGSTANLNSLVFQSTRMNRVPGQPLFLKDLNCHCIDPNKDFVLNPAAWSDVPQGQWGFSAPYYNDYRYARQPSEQLSLGRIFRVTEKYKLQVRAEFFNVLNRVVMPNPSAGNPLQTPLRNQAGVPTSGFGRIDASTVGGQRNGQLVARVEF